eukprot:gnl/MRDRNA2_/MRDRNA2_62367_c0_seq1.p1 gnl/MRDRNA2_/MRDRNA2_62367_c0~~gnl/MRDRNA2_/MRDRNA2_62367_c0_seq1.p1  ORF type:complete len:387 (+),score=88.76 gnl/MRDRNA2_/MRDRNA2_62367_c0_seq1:155-1315(+)
MAVSTPIKATQGFASSLGRFGMDGEDIPLTQPSLSRGSVQRQFSSASVSSLKAAGVVTGLEIATESQNEEELELLSIFAKCDKGSGGMGFSDRRDSASDGVISKRELMTACKKFPEVAAFLHLPQNFGARDCLKLVELFFSGTDTDGDGQLSFAEFKAGYERLRNASFDMTSMTTPKSSWMSSKSLQAISTPKSAPASNASDAMASQELSDKFFALEAKVQMLEKKMKEQEQMNERRMNDQEDMIERKTREREDQEDADRKHLLQKLPQVLSCQDDALRQVLSAYEKNGSCPLCQTLAPAFEKRMVNSKLKLEANPDLLTPGLVSAISEAGQVALAEQMASDPTWFSRERVQAFRGAGRTAAARVMVAACSSLPEMAALVHAELEK